MALEETYGQAIRELGNRDKEKTKKPKKTVAGGEQGSAQGKTQQSEYYTDLNDVLFLHSISTCSFRQGVDPVI